MQWDTGSTNSYRMGKEGKYDLKLAEPLLSVEAIEEDNDRAAEGTCLFAFFIVVEGFFLPLKSS